MVVTGEEEEITQGAYTWAAGQSGVLERQHTNTNHQTGELGVLVSYLDLIFVWDSGGMQSRYHISCTRSKQLEPHIGEG